MSATGMVCVVDDDSAHRESLKTFLAAHELLTEGFGTPQEFLQRPDPGVSTCLIVNADLPQSGGLELMRALPSTGSAPPVIFVTGRGDVRASVEAMKAGALDFLLKPLNHEVLLARVWTALERDQRRRQRHHEMSELHRRLASLSQREVDVFRLVVTGLLNKQAAGVLGLAEITVRVHRGNVMRKMRASSLPDLVRMAMRLGIRPDTTTPYHAWA